MLVRSVDELVARSGALKEALLEFARAPRFDREFRQAVRARFRGPRVVRRRRRARQLLRLDKETVKAYLTDESVDPIPVRRLTARYPDTANRVIRTALGKPALSWERDGEQLLYRYKRAWLARPDLPRVSIINDRLRPYVN